MLLEREAPLNQLEQLCQRACQGRGAIALVNGEAGIGKTSLLEAMKDRLPKGCKTLWGGCDALFTPRPLGPLQDMADSFSTKIREHLAEGVQSSRLYSSVLGELEQNSDGTILVFEDAHWADYATLDLLKYLGRRISMLPALLIISFRNDEVGDDHPLTRVLGELPSSHTSRIDLQSLSLEAVESLGVPPGYSLEDLYTITAGNPFFVTELLEYRHTPGDLIPASIKDAIAARLTRLTPEERTLLETLSVIPGSIPFAILKHLFAKQGETLAMACVGRNLLILDNNESLRFRHELARLANVAHLSNIRKKELHRQVLSAFLAINANGSIQSSYDRIVHHAACAFDSQRVLQYAPLAAASAAAVGAHLEAAAHLSTALQFVNDADSVVAAQLYEDWAYEAGLALRIDDDVLEARRHAITLWRALDRPEKVGDNLRWLSRLHWYRGEAAQADHYADAAINTLESTPQSVQHAKAYSLRSQLHMLNDRMEEAINWGERALNLANQYHDLEIQSHALNNIGTAKIFRGNTAGIEQIRQSLTIAIEQGFHEHAARGYTNLSEYAVEFKDFELAENMLAKGIAYSNQHDLLPWLHYLQGRLALLRLEQGRLIDAETIANGVLKTEKLTLLTRLPALSVLAKTRLRQGIDQAYETLSQALADALTMDELQYVVPLRLAAIELAWLDNSVEKAKEHLQKLEEIGADNMHAWRRGEAVVWAHRIGYSISADYFQDLPEPFQAELDGDNKKAATLWQRLGLPYSAAMSLMQNSDSLHFSNRLIEAQKLLESMQARKPIAKIRYLANELGIGGEIPRTRRGPYNAAKNHPLGLTKREQQILVLVSQGATNKEISDTLSRSQRTVEHHVSSILAKLNTSSRMEAMLRVHNEPWLLPKESKPKKLLS